MYLTCLSDPVQSCVHVGTLHIDGQGASQVRHRKYISELPGICVPISQVHKHLLPVEKKLILQQQVGAFFSGEYTKHIDAEASKCFHCGALDSRLHRLRWCPRTGPWRSLFPSLMRQWDDLPEYLTAFGLVPEPDEWRRWQSTLDSLALPVVERSSCIEIQVFYTDGACMYPRHQMVRVASGTALRAKADGTLEIAWCGGLPGACQSIFRAELLPNWVSYAYCLHGFKICLQSSSTNYRSVAFRCHAYPPAGKQRPIGVLSCMTPCDVDCVQVHWVKGHMDYKNATGVTKIHAWFNHCADLAAKKAFQGHLSPLYTAMLQDFQQKMALAKDLSSFQASRCSFDLCK